MLRALAIVGLTLALSFATMTTRAEPRDLSAPQSNRYYYLHTALTLGALLGTATEGLISSHHGPGYDLNRFGPDDSVRANFSASSAHLSDKLLALNITAPLLLQMSNGFDTRMGNATLIYAEALSLNVLTVSTVKLIVRRPRPYTHSKDPRIIDFMDRQGSDAYASFYSGHASTAFTAATSGSILYALQTDEPGARHTVWGLSFLLAGMTAELRARGGRHYRTDIWVGTLAGIATGTLVPLAHRLDLKQVRPSELATAGGALAVSMILSEVIDFCSALDVLHLCGLPRDVDVPLRDAGLSPRWAIAPLPLAGGGGVSIYGDL